MLKVVRPPDPPPFFLSPGVREEKRRLFEYLRRSDDERRQRRDELNEDLLYQAELHPALLHLFRGKCAFCETPLSSEKEYRIHHFRPLRFARNQYSAPPDKDHYIWLAFEWRNLFMACGFCASAQGELFPVAGPRAPLRSLFEDIVEQEEALLVDPTLQDPGRHLRLLVDGRLLPLTLAGQMTIETFQLNRPQLLKSRGQLADRLVRDLSSYKEALKYLKKLDLDMPHVGALLGLMRRFADAWRPGGRPIGAGRRFIENFYGALERGGPKGHVSLANAIAELRLNEELGTIDLTPFAPPFAQVVQPHDQARPPLPAAASQEIASIEIRAFKAIDELTFTMQSRRTTRAGVPCLMILGENSTGKSSVLSAIALALIGEREARKVRGLNPVGLVHSSRSDQWDQLDLEPVEASVSFQFSDHIARFRYDPARRIIEGNREPSTIVLGYGPRRFFNRRKHHRPAGAAARVRSLFDPLATIPYPGDWLLEQRGSRFDTLMAALRIVLSLDEDDELVIEPDQGVCVRANGRVTPIELLSEGYRSVFVMTVDIFRELLDHWDNLETAQAVVLIDEIETHLHPRWKMQVMTSLRQVLPRVQFIVTTHDPLCLRGMDDGEVEVLQRDAEERIRRLPDLPSVRGMTAEQLLTSDFFGLASTADPATELALARLVGDAARKRPDGTLEIAPSLATTDLVSRLVVGDSPSEQVVQEALQQYLEDREKRVKGLRTDLRTEAVEAVVKALSAEPG